MGQTMSDATAVPVPRLHRDEGWAGWAKELDRARDGVRVECAIEGLKE